MANRSKLNKGALKTPVANTDKYRRALPFIKKYYSNLGVHILRKMLNLCAIYAIQLISFICWVSHVS